MAWTCSGSTNQELVQNLRDKGLIQSDSVAMAMSKVDRKHYVPDAYLAYHDSPQIIGFGATISAPHMHVHALEILLPMIERAELSGGAVLDVGSGSGYLFRYLAPRATVVGIDHIPTLTERSKTNLKNDGVKDVIILCGDGRLGSQEHGPFQVIHVGAAAPSIPAALIEQLASPGRMFIPVGEATQHIWQVDKDADGRVSKTKLFGVRYVALTDAK